MTRKLLMLFLVFTTTLVSLSQTVIPSSQSSNKSPKHSVRGYLKDLDKQEGLAYATVSVFDSITPISAAYTDDKGGFKLSVPSGSYTLRASLLGYGEISQPLTVQTNIVLDTIYMSEGVLANEAVIVGQLVTTDIDKTTYNTAADPETQALTALEIMRKVPMLSVDGEDNLRLNGQTNYKILINGKSSTLMNSNYKEVLKSMPAGAIKNIEVITNPPAKYDAEGIGGIINIITDRKSVDGFNGSVGAGIRRFGSWNANGYIAASLGKFNFSASYYVGENISNGATQDVKRENFNNPSMKYINSYGDANKANNFSQNFNLEGSYEIDTMNLLTLSVSGYFGRGKVKGVMQNEFLNSDFTPVVQYSNKTSNIYGYSSMNASLDYQRSFKKKEETFTASYKFDYNGNPSSYSNDITSLLNYVSSNERSNSYSWGAEHTLQLDYFNPINDHHQIEVGGKLIFRPNMSDSKHEYMVDDQWLINPDRRNDLDYLQYIGAVYGAYQYKLKKFSVKVGFRGEYTLNTGTFKMREDQSLFNRYFNIVPYATIGFKPTDKDNLRIGYTQRLSRPDIWDLNPYYNDANPLNVSTGNPNLDSEISNAFDITYGRFDGIYNINIGLAASFTNNSIEQTFTKLDNGAILSKPENIGLAQRYSLYLNGGIRTLKGKLNFNLNLNTAYSIIDANNGSGMRNEGWSGSAFLNINSTPWKNGSISAHGGVYYGGVGLQSDSRLMHFIGFSVGHWFLNKTLRVNANVSDPFTKYRTFRSSTFSDTFNQTQEYKRLAQTFGVSVQWRFGKTQTQVKKTNRSISNDDIKSSGKSQGDSGSGAQ